MRWINRKPGRPLLVFLAALPFVLTLIAYMAGSAARLAENPRDKFMPAPTTLLERAGELISEPDRRKGYVLFWADTWASLDRLARGVAIAAALALAFGLLIGLFPTVKALFSSYVSAISLIPPLALAPILFIALGLGEVSKIALIVIGTAPVMIRDLAQRTIEIPQEQIVKAQTLGASSWQIMTRIALPQVMPRLIQAVRLGLGPAWLFLIAAETVSAEAGLGYRIFLVRRYAAMDVIIPYVIWITLLALLIDYALRQTSRLAYGWAEPEAQG
ncbi:MAG: ABC transporter permease subunit [Neomegalonema sp.]|nr:ABC transporter permease subunit [Neomegalonema sp.]